MTAMSSGAPPSLRLKRGVEPKYGGWRPILPGSPFFFGGARSLAVHNHPHEPAAHENVPVQAPPPRPTEGHSESQQEISDHPRPPQDTHPPLQHDIQLQALHPLPVDGQHQIQIEALRPQQHQLHPSPANGQHQIQIEAFRPLPFEGRPQQQHQINIEALGPLPLGGQPAAQHQISIEALRPIQVDGHAASQHQINMEGLRPLPVESHVAAQHQINVEDLRQLPVGGQAAAQHQLGIHALPDNYQQHQFAENKPYPQSPVPDKDIFSYYPPPTTPRPYNSHQPSDKPLYVEHAKKPFEHPFGKDVPILEIGLHTPFKVLPINVIGPHHPGESLAQSTMQAAIAEHQRFPVGPNEGAFPQVPHTLMASPLDGVPSNQEHINFQQIGQQNRFQRFPDEQHAATTGSNDAEGFQPPRKPENFPQHQEEQEMTNEQIAESLKFQEGLAQEERLNQQQSANQPSSEENRFQQFQQPGDQVRFPEQDHGNPAFMDDIRIQQIGDQNAFRPDEAAAYQLPSQQETIREEDRLNTNPEDNPTADQQKVESSREEDDNYQHIREQSVFHSGPQANQEYRPTDGDKEESQNDDMHKESDQERGVYEASGYHQHESDSKDKEHQESNIKPDPEESNDYRLEEESYKPQHLSEHFPREEVSNSDQTNTLQEAGPEQVHFPGERGQLRPRPAPVYSPPTRHEYALPVPTYSQPIPADYGPQEERYHQPPPPPVAYDHQEDSSPQSQASSEDAQEEKAPFPQPSYHPPPQQEPFRPLVYHNYNPQPVESVQATEPPKPTAFQNYHHQPIETAQATEPPKPIIYQNYHQQPVENARPTEPPKPIVYQNYHQQPVENVRPREPPKPTVYQNDHQQPVESVRATEQPPQAVQHQPSSTSYFTTFGSSVHKQPEQSHTHAVTHGPPSVQVNEHTSTSKAMEPPLVAPPSFHVYGSPKKPISTFPLAKPRHEKEPSIVRPVKVTTTTPPSTTTTARPLQKTAAPHIGDEVIHMSPDSEKKSNGTQVYHAYYAPADHKPPEGYVRLTVSEFNKMFNTADIQYVGAETTDPKTSPSGDSPKVLLSGAPDSNKIEEEATAQDDDDGPILTLDLKPGQSVEDALSELGTIDVAGVRVDASQLKEGRDFEVVDVQPVNNATTTTTTTTPRPASLLVDDGHFGERIKKKKS